MSDALRENTRIDKGLPRPRYQHKPPKRVKQDGLAPTIPADLDPDMVLDRYLIAETTSGIALELGIRRHTLTRWLKAVRPEQWKQAQVIRALLRKEDGDDGIANARDALSLARAREQVRSGQWDLERLDSSNYGQKVEQVIEVNHNLIVDKALIEDAKELMKSIRGITQQDQLLTIEHKEDSSSNV